MIYIMINLVNIKNEIKFSGLLFRLASFNKIKNLREFIITNLEKKGDLIRWSIVDIQNSIDSFGIKQLKIKAVLAN